MGAKHHSQILLQLLPGNLEQLYLVKLCDGNSVLTCLLKADWLIDSHD